MSTKAYFDSLVTADVTSILTSLSSDEVKIADFAISKSADLTAMSPEADPLIDVKKLSKILSSVTSLADFAATINSQMKSADGDKKRPAKNLSFAYKYITMSDADKAILINWVARAEAGDKDALAKGPVITGLSTKASKNYIGYLNTDRFNVNCAVLRSIVLNLQSTESTLSLSRPDLRTTPSAVKFGPSGKPFTTYASKVTEASSPTQVLASLQTKVSQDVSLTIDEVNWLIKNFNLNPKLFTEEGKVISQSKGMIASLRFSETV